MASGSQPAFPYSHEARSFLKRRAVIYQRCRKRRELTAGTIVDQSYGREESCGSSTPFRFRYRNARPSTRSIPAGAFIAARARWTEETRTDSGSASHGPRRWCRQSGSSAAGSGRSVSGSPIGCSSADELVTPAAGHGTQPDPAPGRSDSAVRTSWRYLNERVTASPPGGARGPGRRGYWLPGPAGAASARRAAAERSAAPAAPAAPDHPGPAEHA
jgi:hypothetical protein